MLGLLSFKVFIVGLGIFIIIRDIIPAWLGFVSSTKKSRFKWLRSIATVMMVLASVVHFLVDDSDLAAFTTVGIVILSTLVYKGKVDHLFAKSSQLGQDLISVPVESIQQPSGSETSIGSELKH